MTNDRGIPAPGPRLPAETTVGPVRLQVADVDRSVEFYVGTLGLVPLSREPGSASLGAPDRRVLVRLDERAGAAPVPRQGRLGLYHFAILLPDRPSLGSFLAHVRGLGLRVGLADHLVSEAIYLHDPDGLGIEVYADRPRGQWTYRGSEFLLATDPMNVDDVLAAANATQWEGVPAGTVMGHVHLHVGDVTRAADFYHRALGFDQTTWSYPGALFLSAGGYHHHLAVNTWAPPVAPTATDARLLEWSLVLPDDETLTAVAVGLEEAGSPVSRSDGSWTVTDPWGTTLRATTPGGDTTGAVAGGGRASE